MIDFDFAILLAVAPLCAFAPLREKNQGRLSDRDKPDREDDLGAGIKARDACNKLKEVPDEAVRFGDKGGVRTAQIPSWKVCRQDRA